MTLELDHLFVCVTQGAPEAEILIQSGFREGPRNTHPGQGTANRRFFFQNAMLELLYISDPIAAQSELTAPTRLFERFNGGAEACPFGICLRPSKPGLGEPPFPTWQYKPAYLPTGSVLHIAEAPIEEPMWVYIGFGNRATYEQPNGARKLTGITLTTPSPLDSQAARAAVSAGVLSVRAGAQHLGELHFDNCRNDKAADFRPSLPLLLHY
jgi:hypothetical protein